MQAKRWFIAASYLSAVGVLLASCTSAAPAPTPQTAPPAKPAETRAPVAKPAAPTGTPAASTAGQPKYGGSITRMTIGYPDSLDPHFSRGSPFWAELMAPLYNGLFKLDAKMEIAPDLVEKWEQPNELEYVLHLRQGVKFHDTPVMKGRELTAEDVKWNIQRMSTEDPRFFRRFQFRLVSKIDVLDRYIVRLTLKERTAPFMHFMAQPFNWMVGREAVEKDGNLNRAEAGTGPYYLKSWTDKVSYKLAKNSNYFIKGVPYLDDINVVIVLDSATRLAAFRSKRADYVVVNHQDFTSLKRTNPQLTSSVIPTQFEFLTFFPGKKPFDDPRIRQAFSLTIDRQALIEVVTDGDGELIGPIFGVADSWKLPKDEIRRLYKPDVTQAKRLMAEAGYPNGFPLDVKVSSRRPYAMDALTLITPQLKQIGVEVKQVVMDHTTLTAQRDAGDYVALIHGGTAALEPAERIEQYWRTKGMYHLTDPELDRLLDEQRRETDVSKRRQLINQFERRMIEAGDVLFLFGSGEYQVRQPHIKGPIEPSNLSQHLVAYNWIES
ncbi:MAG: ABC transporter substrate-binding protein [Chloroflexi bacterium]|nr:ABC transporter substrate-binding protein [Chloroflexota bacterium]